MFLPTLSLNRVHICCEHESKHEYMYYIIILIHLFVSTYMYTKCRECSGYIHTCNSDKIICISNEIIFNSCNLKQMAYVGMIQANIDYSIFCTKGHLSVRDYKM